MGSKAILPLLLVACHNDAGDTHDSRPMAWTLEPARSLEVARPWVTTTLQGSRAITRLRHDPRSAVTFAVDPSANRVHLLDELFHHSADPRCIPPDDLNELAEESWQGSCAGENVELHRGFVIADQPLDLAINPEGQTAWVVMSGGALLPVNLALESGATLSYLRAGVPVPTGLSPRSAVWSDGLWLALPSECVRLEDGEIVEHLAWASATLLDGEGGLWALTPEGLRGPFGEDPLPATVAAAAGGLGLAWSEGVLRWSSGEQVEFSPSPEALALDPQNGTAWALAEGGLWRAPLGQTPTRVAEAPEALTLLVTPTHDVVLAQADGVQVLLDEQALQDSSLPPVQLNVITFLETPRSTEDRIICDAPHLDSSLSQGLHRAAAGATLIDTLPGAFGIGVTSRFAEAVLHCNMTQTFAPWTQRDLGLLVHGTSGCADPDCALEYLEHRLGRLRAVGADPRWAAGLSEESALDPILALQGLGLRRQLFFSAGMDPSISLEDPLWKQPWPLLPGEDSPAFALSSLDAWPGGEPAGEVALYPGNTVRGFALGACEGLLAMECLLLNRGSDLFEAEDAQAIGLLARHAIARRGQGLYTWSWHWPDLSTYDATDGCSVSEDGLWSQDPSSDTPCEAVVLQDILWDLELSLVANGLAEWREPSSLDWPAQASP